MKNTQLIDEIYNKFFENTMCGKDDYEFSLKSKLKFYQYISCVIEELYGNQNANTDEILKRIKVTPIIPFNYHHDKGYKGFTYYIGFILENEEGKQAIIHLTIDYVCCDGIKDDLKFLFGVNISGKVIEPFMDLKYSTIKPLSDLIYVTDPKTRKTFIYSIIEEKAISKGFDHIEKDQPWGYRIENKGKIGRFSVYSKDFHIPAKYDEITRISTCRERDLLSSYYDETRLMIRNKCYVVDKVRKGDKVGAYCYTKDFHVRYHLNEDRFSHHAYIKKAFIPPTFDTIECLAVRDELFLIISNNGKYGVVAPYKHKVIGPICFDKILEVIILDDHSCVICGEIDGEEYYYKNESLVKMQQCDELVPADVSPLKRIKTNIHKNA